MTMLSSAFGNSYEQLLSQIRNWFRDSEISDELFETLQNAFRTALKAQKVVLSQAEKDRLFQTIAGEVLGEMQSMIDKGLNA